MADTLDVLTLAEGHTAINLPSATTDYDTELALQITAISRLLDDEVGRVVQRAVTDELHDGGKWVLVTRQWPVASFTTVTEDLAGTPTVVTAYRKEPFDRIASLFSGRIEHDTRVFTDGRWNTKVTYVAGRYANTAAVDARFKSCAGAILRRLWKRESGTWAQSSDFFEGLDNQVGSGFFRVAKPIIDEMLPDELTRYSYSRQKHFGVA